MTIEEVGEASEEVAETEEVLEVEEGAEEAVETEVNLNATNVVNLVTWLEIAQMLPLKATDHQDNKWIDLLYFTLLQTLN